MDLPYLENQTWYLKMSQLALALAIIRSKPPEKSSKEYTEHLARIVSGQDFKWRSKVEALEAEVLRLRQELLLSKISPRFYSGCDVSSDYTVDTSDMLQNFGPSEHSFNPSSSEFSTEILPILKSHGTSKAKALTPNIQFLQHLLELRKLTEAGDLKTDFTKLGNDYSTISESVLRLLDGLIIFCHNPEHPSSKFLSEAVCVLNNLINDATFSNHIQEKCFKKLEEFKKKLIELILNSSNINRFQVQESMSHTLVLLGRCCVLRKSIISLLLSEVNRFADELWHANQIQAPYDVTQYENTFFLCRILEQLLEKGTEEDKATTSDFDEEEKNKFLQNLDHIIIHLSDEFPLFCLYVWRLGALLNSTNANCELSTVTSRSES
uniref:Meiotic double-stranded break formation protein 4 n=1 Tax=Sphenodon punctatus TaxID=8508 RepID=A0A8D0GGH9_SPHPU